MLTSGPPEFDFLTSCVRPDGVVGPDPAKTVVTRNFDWELVLEYGRRNGVTPLLARGIQQFDSSDSAVDVPASVRSTLTEQTRSIAMRNVRLATELHQLLEAFADRGVRALPFKGPVLEAVAYGEVGMRAYRDLDLLVPRTDVTAAVDVLEAHGYTWPNGPRLDDGPILGGWFTMPLVPEYELQSEHLLTEVRWRVGDRAQPFSPNVTTLWERRETVTVAGSEIPALAPADRLRMLAYHGTKHKWHQLKWACDFAAAQTAADVDWETLLAAAREHGDERRVLISAALIDRLFDYTLPAPVQELLTDDPRAEVLAAMAIEELCLEGSGRPERTDRLSYTARATDSVTDALRTVLFHSRLHPGLREYQHLPLPRQAHLLYYFVFPLYHLLDRARRGPTSDSP